MGKLTLSEITQLAEKVTGWVRGGHFIYEPRDKRNNYVGDFIDQEMKVEISCGLSGIFPWEKRAEVKIWASKNKGSSERVAYEEGAHIYSIYQKIKVLAEELIREREYEQRRDKTTEINQACEEVREKYLK